ncbi:MAG: hypothetical protein JOY71_25415, partial [Acetobacteraceae bacterium]|nr:hypothetical protein [Acetobacteraceae bacterium]
MDPISLIVTALALGAGAAIKGIAGDASKDAYQGLKALIKTRYGEVDVEALEGAPDSMNRRSVIEENLRAADASKDRDLLAKAQALLEAIRKEAPAAAAVIGVDLMDVEAVSLHLREIVARGTGVKLEKGRFTGDIEISGVQAGVTGTDPAKIGGAGISPGPPFAVLTGVTAQDIVIGIPPAQLPAIIAAGGAPMTSGPVFYDLPGLPGRYLAREADLAAVRANLVGREDILGGTGR